MPLPVTVYRWDDAGAPSIGTQKPSEIINILRKCLVDGYGSKSPLGWTVAFEDAPTNKIAFRKPTAQGDGYVQFGDVLGTNPNQGDVRFRTAASMTALDSFIHPQIEMRFKLASNQLYWVLIGTEKGFWFFTHHSLTTPDASTNSAASFFIGDIDSFSANDPGRFVNIMYTSSTDMTGVSWSYSFINGISPGSTICRIYDTDGSDNYLLYKMDQNYRTDVGAGINGVPQGDRTFHRLILQSPLSIGSSDRLGVTASNSIVSPYYRGEIPGLLNTPQSGYKDAPWPVIETIGGQQHMLMPGYKYGRIWVNMETWYG